MSKNIFIDCGSHDGCSIRKFRDTIDTTSNYYLYSFEANPNLQFYYDSLYDKHYHFNKAVWIYDGKIPFTVFGHTGGSTLIKTKADHDESKRVKKEQYKIPKSEKINVDCIDLSKWIMENFDKNDNIILKFDVEGAEYKIIEKMIADGSIDYIDKMFIEFHNTRCGYTLNDDMKILEQCNKRNIVCDDTWDAMHKPYLLENRCLEYNPDKPCCQPNI